MKIGHITPTKMQFLNASELRRLDEILIVAPKNHPEDKLAVLIPWSEFFRLESIDFTYLRTAHNLRVATKTENKDA